MVFEPNEDETNRASDKNTPLNFLRELRSFCALASDTTTAATTLRCEMAGLRPQVRPEELEHAAETGHCLLGKPFAVHIRDIMPYDSVLWLSYDTKTRS